ncbi:MAG: Rieske 2Fe-2S domain-containing protein [Bacteroidetes bacterium]|jgi:nitrite reductase (NADH) small subunit|nr:Rieske 2Fe-2S domain-containing protein [Bacteroidota bacterium]
MEGMTAIGQVGEIKRRLLTPAKIDGASVVVIALPDGFQVVENRCPHQQADILHEGSVDDGGLTCPLHGRTFDLVDGRCRNGAGRLTLVPWKQIGDTLWAGPLPAQGFSSF